MQDRVESPLRPAGCRPGGSGEGSVAGVVGVKGRRTLAATVCCAWSGTALHAPCTPCERGRERCGLSVASIDELLVGRLFID